MDLTGRLRLEKQCVPGDAYDEAAARVLFAQDPGFERCRRRGEALLCSFPSLLEDLFRLVFKMRPTLVDRTRVRPGLQLNRYLLASLLRESKLGDLRAKTVLDEEASGAATLALAAEMIRRLEGKKLDRENELFVLERAVEEEGREGGHPPEVASVKPPSASVFGSGKGEGNKEAINYDLQTKLELAESLASYRRFERLLSLIERIEALSDVQDLTQWRSPEVYDIGTGGELSRLLPGELLGLRAASRKGDFLRRLIEGALLNYRIEDRSLPGPLVLLIDASDSMAGEKEIAAKALALALWRAAAERGQGTSTMVFGPPTAKLWRTDFCGARPGLHEMRALAETFIGGGTDFERPIRRAVEELSVKSDSAGQIVLISDGLCDVTARWASQIEALKTRRRIRILGIMVDLGRFSEHSLTRISDLVIRWSHLAGESEDPASRRKAPP